MLVDFSVNLEPDQSAIFVFAFVLSLYLLLRPTQCNCQYRNIVCKALKVCDFPALALILKSFVCQLSSCLVIGPMVTQLTCCGTVKPWPPALHPLAGAQNKPVLLQPVGGAVDVDAARAEPYHKGRARSPDAWQATEVLPLHTRLSGCTASAAPCPVTSQ